MRGGWRRHIGTNRDGSPVARDKALARVLELLSAPCALDLAGCVTQLVQLIALGPLCKARVRRCAWVVHTAFAPAAAWWDDEAGAAAAGAGGGGVAA